VFRVPLLLTAMTTSETRRTRVGVYALCADADLLLLTRLWPGDHHGGRWTLPGGGIHWGESPLEALRRELWEETGLRGEVVGLVDVMSFVLARKELHALQIVYRVAASGEPRVVEQGGSTVDARWVPLSEIERMEVTPMVTEVMARLGS